VKSPDLQSREELTSQLQALADELRERARSDRQALATDENQSGDAVKEQSKAELDAAEPGIAAISQDDYNDAVGAPGAPGSSAFERGFNDVRRTLFASLSTDTGFSGLFKVAAQNALDIVAEIENIAAELAVEATKLAAADATGLLVPPTAADMIALRDASGQAQSDIGMMQGEVNNAIARREAIRDREAPTDDFQNRIPTGGTADDRYISQTERPTEGDVREDVGISIASGSTRSIPAVPTIVSNQAQRTSELLQASFIERAGFVVICAAIASLNRSKELQTRAVFLTAKLITLIDKLRGMAEEGFLASIQEDLQEQTNELLQSLSDSLQDKLDAIDSFLNAVVQPPSTFVSLVEALGDTPGDIPLLQGLANVCDIKIGSFCDAIGLMEIAKSLDADLSIGFTKPPQFGRAILTVAAIEDDQVDRETPIPGIEAYIHLWTSEPSGSSQVEARFPERDRPQTYDDTTGGLKERADVFGTGSGRLVIESPGVDDAAEEIVYTSASFDDLTGVYTFNLQANSARDHLPTLIAAPDNVPVQGTDPRTAIPVGTSAVQLRMDINVAKDIDLTVPGNVVLGTRETTNYSGQCDASATANEAKLYLQPTDPPLGNHLIGQTITFGRNRGRGQFTGGVVSGGNTLTSPTAVFDTSADGHAAFGGRIVLIGGRHRRRVTAVNSTTEIEFAGDAIDAGTYDFTITRQVDRAIVSIVDVAAGIVEYDGVDLSTDTVFIAVAPNTDFVTENKFGMSFAHNEALPYSSITGPQAFDPDGEIFTINLTTPTAFPHAVHKVDRRQRTVRVFPDDQVQFLDFQTFPQGADTRTSVITLPSGSTLVRGTFDDPNQELILGPVLVAASSGEMQVAGSAFFDYDDVAEEAGDVYAFTINAGTPATFEAGDQIVVLTTSIFDQVQVQFAAGWEEPLDDWIRELGRQLTRFESTVCRLLGGRQENFGAVAAALALASASVASTLLTTRILIGSWLLGLPSDDSVDKGLTRLDGAGADRAASSIRDGDIGTFGAMNSGDATSAGAGLNTSQSLSTLEATDVEYANSQRIAAILNSRNHAQSEDLQSKEEAAKALERLSEDLA
jgi:hypothetical protein